MYCEEEKGIFFKDDHECNGENTIKLALKNNHKIIHVKGFASGIPPSNEFDTRTQYKSGYSTSHVDNVKKLESSFLDILNNDRKDVIIVWDGDDYREDSFTRYIKLLMDYPFYHFVAIKKDVEELENSWGKVIKEKNVNIHVYEAPSRLSYKELGIWGLKQKVKR